MGCKMSEVRILSSRPDIPPVLAAGVHCIRILEAGFEPPKKRFDCQRKLYGGIAVSQRLMSACATQAARRVILSFHHRKSFAVNYCSIHGFFLILLSIFCLSFKTERAGIFPTLLLNLLNLLLRIRYSFLLFYIFTSSRVQAKNWYFLEN